MLKPLIKGTCVMESTFYKKKKKKKKKKKNVLLIIWPDHFTFFFFAFDHRAYVYLAEAASLGHQAAMELASVAYLVCLTNYLLCYLTIALVLIVNNLY